MNILVSACLLGINCKYDGGNNLREDVKALINTHNLIPFCPEVYGGMPTPRIPSERRGDMVINAEGQDVTEYFIKGADMALKLAKDFDCKYAILKVKSPSCGAGKIYDGSFTKTLTDGDGMTAELLKKHGIIILEDSETDKIKELSGV